MQSKYNIEKDKMIKNFNCKTSLFRYADGVVFKEANLRLFNLLLFT